jgi:hypothetical protein
LGGLARAVLAASAGWLVGTAVQLQQSALWQGWIYASIGGLALEATAWIAIKLVANFTWSIGIFITCMALAFALTGWRSSVFLAQALNPVLEGRDVWVTGRVSNLPQRNDAGLRFRLKVETAEFAGKPVALPRTVDVGWYAGVYPTGTEMVGLQRQPADVRAGERWSMTLRLKAPHGSSNPHGFDYELFLWEQGVQATGYVRAGVNDAPPLRLEQTWRHPVALARQSLRERIIMQVEQRQFAGLCALVVGDQNYRPGGLGCVSYWRCASGGALVCTSPYRMGCSWLVGWAVAALRVAVHRMPAPTAALAAAAGGCVCAVFRLGRAAHCPIRATVALLPVVHAGQPLVGADRAVVRRSACGLSLVSEFCGGRSAFATNLELATQYLRAKACRPQPWTLRALRSVIFRLREQW